MKVILTIPSATDRMKAAASAIPELELLTVGVEPTVTIGFAHRRIRIIDLAAAVHGPSRLYADETVDIVTDGALSARDRKWIEDTGRSWWDLRGAIHVEFGGVLLHIERTSRKPLPQEGRSLGPAGARAVQVMLINNVHHAWSVSELAERADLSVGQTHTVLTMMEERGLVTSLGAGSHRRRLIADSDRCLDWLMDQERTRRVTTSIRTYIYARNDRELATWFHERSVERGVIYACTSTLGASLLGTPVVTTSQMSHIRVRTPNPEAAREALDLDDRDPQSERGANLTIWVDTGDVGTHDATLVQGVWVAPPVRVWLDLVHAGGRAMEGAEQFREIALRRG